MKLSIATFRNKHDNQPKQKETTWEALSVVLMQHKEREEKDGPLWSPTLYRPGKTRANANVIEVSCLALDFDKGASPEEFGRPLRGMTAVMHTTFGHHPEAPKWRVVLPLSTPVPGAEWPYAWEQMTRHFGGGGLADPACKDASRMYYTPSCPPGAERDTMAQEGVWLDPAGFIRPSVELLLSRAMGHIGEGRNVAGMWLACQLRDHFYTQPEAEQAAWHQHVPREKVGKRGQVDVYDADEWHENVRKAYTRVPRAPWTPSANGSQPVANGSYPTAEKTRRRIEGVTAAQLMAMDLPELKWAVPGVLCQGLNILAGAPKLGKSWLALSTAIAIASGGKALGKIHVVQGDVLYLALEDTKRRLQDRLRILLQGSPAPDRLTLFTEWPRLDEDGINWIRQWRDKSKDGRLVVIDTLKKVRPPRIKGGQIYDEDYEFMADLKGIADEGHLSTWVLHHVRKSSAEDIFDTVSGSIGLTGAADATQVLTRARGRKEGLLHITGRDVEEQADEDAMALDWSAETGSWTIVGTARDVLRTDERKQIIDFASGHAVFTISQVVKATGKNISTVTNLMTKMLDADDLEKAGYGKYRLAHARAHVVKRESIDSIEHGESVDSVESSGGGEYDSTARWR